MKPNKTRLHRKKEFIQIHCKFHCIEINTDISIFCNFIQKVQIRAIFPFCISYKHCNAYYMHCVCMNV